MSEHPDTPQPENQHQPEARPPKKGRGGAIALLVVGIVLLLCGCGSVVGADQSSMSGGTVEMATVVVLRLAFLVGGLVLAVIGAVKLVRNT